MLEVRNNIWPMMKNVTGLWGQLHKGEFRNF